MAQQPEQSPKTKEKGQPTEHGPKPGRNVEKKAPEGAEPGAPHGPRGQHAGKTPMNEPNAATSPSTEVKTTGPGGKKGKKGGANTTAETGATASPGASQPVEPGKKGGKKGRGEARTTAGASAAPVASANGAPSATAAAGTTTGTNAKVAEGTVGKGGKKVEKQQVQQIKQQHANFKAQPKPNVAPAVTFNQNYRIQNAQNWQGPQYEVFRSYHPEWHDQGWYHQRYQRVVLIGGGWYFWNAGYWYPAWGYDPGVAYYPYDGPIYVGHRAEPPDQVIADVQAELKEMGYYQGEVDGLLGPMTRQALSDYQADHGLAVTEAIDEPTLDALELS